MLKAAGGTRAFWLSHSVEGLILNYSLVLALPNSTVTLTRGSSQNWKLFQLCFIFKKMSEPTRIPSAGYIFSHFTTPKSKLTPCWVIHDPSQPGWCISAHFLRLLWEINQASPFMLSAGTSQNFSETLWKRKKSTQARICPTSQMSYPAF